MSARTTTRHDEREEEDDPLKDICVVIIHSEKSRKTYIDATRQDPQLHDLLVHVRKWRPSARKYCTDMVVVVNDIHMTLMMTTRTTHVLIIETVQVESGG